MVLDMLPPIDNRGLHVLFPTSTDPSTREMSSPAIVQASVASHQILRSAQCIAAIAIFWSDINLLSRNDEI